MNNKASGQSSLNSAHNALTEGSVFFSISSFALPMLAGNMMQQLYNIADTWVVGRYIGTDALAAVGSVFALMVFLTSVLLGLCMGSGAVFSQDFGRSAFRDLERKIGTAFLLIAAITLIITFSALAGHGFLIRWMNIPEELTGITADYLKIILCGIPAVFLYNFFSGYLKSIGNSVTPLLILAAASVTNIILDLVLVAGMKAGISGAAAATILAQYLSAGCSVYYCFRKEEAVRNAFRSVRVRQDDLKILSRYSIYTCLQQSVMNLGILLVQGIVNSFGASVMAAFSAGVKIDAFAYMPAQEYGNAFSTFLAQNHGAGKQDRVEKGTKTGMLTTMVYCAIASAVLYFLAEPLMGIFVATEHQEIIAIGVSYLHIEGLFYIGIGILFLWYGYFRALGRPQVSLILTIISLGTRVVLAKIAAVTSIGVTGIWWSIPIGWALADLAGLLIWRRKHTERTFQ